jgi:hypothetical protein
LAGWKHQNFVSIKVNGEEIESDGRYSLTGVNGQGTPST